MRVQAVLFDMGGVLVDVQAPVGLVGGGIDGPTAWRRWLTSPAVRAFERGALTIEDFAEALVAEQALDEPVEVVVERVRTIPTGLLAGAAELVSEVRARVPVGVLSNTNHLHWTRQRDADVLQVLFDHRFLSYELGLVKPDREVYEHAADALGLPPGAVAFLDDNALNVDAAAEVGMQAAVAVGPDAARAVLEELGVVDGRP